MLKPRRWGPQLDERTAKEEKSRCGRKTPPILKTAKNCKTLKSHATLLTEPFTSNIHK